MTNITSMTTTKEAMKAGKITAKLRDAVQVSFMVGEDERVRYKNIEIPEALKELPIIRFGFDIRPEGKIEFILHFEEGVLPKEFPAKRERQHRKGKDAPAMPTTPPTTAIVAAKPAEDAPKPQAAIVVPVAPEKAAKPAEAKKPDAAPIKPTAKDTAKKASAPTAQKSPPKK